MEADALQYTIQNYFETLPNVKGKYNFSVPLAGLTWFQVGGPAKVIYKPEDTADLQHFLKYFQGGQYFTIGAGSNILVRDGGYDGVVIKLGRNFSKIDIQDNELIVGAAALDRTVAMFAMQHGYSGVEFLVSIPGSIGGAVAMNAGCYGYEIKDILEWTEIIDAEGLIHRLQPSDLGFSYRKAILPKGCVLVRSGFKVYPGNQVEIQQKMQGYLNLREESQPTKGRTGGSTFKNPENSRAWELIDQAQCRGLAIGAAQMSEKHCNFMLNTGGATASDLENLGELVRNRVQKASGFQLEWEIIRIGV